MTSDLRATVLMSGGIDSAACAHHLIERGYAVGGVFVDYGQSAAPREKAAAYAMAQHLGIHVQLIAVAGLEPSGAGELVGRNAFLIFTALLTTQGHSALLGLGLHSGTPYYDCSESFLAAAAKLVGEHTDGMVTVVAPFARWTKKDVYDYFRAADLPISATYSCEAGTDPICGDCASCRDRKALGC